MSVNVTRLELYDSSFKPKSSFQPGEPFWLRVYLTSTGSPPPTIRLQITLDGSVVKEDVVASPPTGVEAYVNYQLAAPSQAGSHSVCAEVVG